MDNQKLQELILAKKQGEAKQKEQEQIAQEKRLADYADRLNEWNERVREWIKNILTIVSSGYGLYDTHSLQRGYLTTAEQKLFAIKTDSIYHEFGVFTDGTLGVAQGGACGDWHIHTDGNSWWIKCGGHRSELREKDYEDLFRKSREDGLNKLERFAKKMDAIYEYFNQ